MRTLLAAVVMVAVGLASPAWACINDVESAQHEREFRSQYGEPTTPPAPAGWPLAGMIDPTLSGVGGALLTGAFFLGLKQRGARS